MLLGRKNLLEVLKSFFMTRGLSKEIMKRSRLSNRFLKNESQENRMLYTQQRNYCVSLLRKTKIRYYANLNEKKP